MTPVPIRVPNTRHVALIPVLLALLSCKPSDEPQFPWGPPPADHPFQPGVEKEKDEPEKPEPVAKTDTGGTTDGEEPEPDAGEEPGEPDVEVPDPATPDVTVAEDVEEPAPDVEVEPDVGDPGKLPELHPAIVASIARKATRKQRLEARRLNSEGLLQHKAKNYKGAADKYRLALASDGRARFPRYNLACALSLDGQPDEALQHLMALRELRHERKLADARVDSDFEPMRGDPRFVRLTGYTTVELMRRSGVSRRALRSLADLVVKLARHQPHVSDRAPVSPPRGTVYHSEAFEQTAKGLADTLAFALAPKPDALVTDAEIVVVLVRDEEVQQAAGRALEELYDRKLHGKSRRGEHTLLLKSTGFFTETIYDEDDESSLKRSGTFTIEGDELVRAYKETRETDDGVTGPNQRSDRLSFAVSGKTLKLDGVKLKP